MDKKKLQEIQKQLPDHVTLIAVSKTHTKEEVDEAYTCGCQVFGENKVQELKEKDIIYLYITGETSPKGTWENMITDIHGEHFRVTNEQWSFLMSNFNIRGVPTYFVVDPEGNITFKQTGFPGVDTMKKELMKALNK